MILLFVLPVNMYAQIEWKPIKQITEEEINILRGAMGESYFKASGLFTDAVAFQRSNRDIIKVLFNSGTEGFYGYNGGLIFEKSGVQNNNNSSDNSEETKQYQNNIKINLEQIHNNFIGAWWNFDEDIHKQEADELAEKYFRLLCADPNVLSELKNSNYHQVLRFAKNGNRYINFFKPILSSLSDEALINFYFEYIGSELARLEDRPSIRDLGFAMENLRHMFSKGINYDMKKFYSDIAMDEISLLNPNLYHLIRQKKMPDK